MQKREWILVEILSRFQFVYVWCLDGWKRWMHFVLKTRRIPEKECLVFYWGNSARVAVACLMWGVCTVECNAHFEEGRKNGIVSDHIHNTPETQTEEIVLCNNFMSSGWPSTYIWKKTLLWLSWTLNEMHVKLEVTVALDIWRLKLINPFTAPACKISGLTDARTCLQTVYFPVP